MLPLSAVDARPSPFTVILAPNSRCCSSRDRRFFRSGRVPVVVVLVVDCGVQRSGEPAGDDVDDEHRTSPLTCDQPPPPPPLLVLTGSVCLAFSCYGQNISHFLIIAVMHHLSCNATRANSDHVNSQHGSIGNQRATGQLTSGYLTLTQNNAHLLQHFLLPKIEKHCRYSTRARPHNYQLQRKTFLLDECNFIYRMLYCNILPFMH